MSPIRRIGIQAKTVQKGPSNERIALVLLDNAYNGFIKRILWHETGSKRISIHQSDAIAGALTALIELSENAILHEITPELWVEFIRQSANRIDSANRIIQSEKAAENVVKPSKGDITTLAEIVEKKYGIPLENDDIPVEKGGNSE
jgi:hypothetical protein